MAELLGCVVENGSVRVDEFQQTSVAQVFSAGESTGIGGLELSLVEGEIAGLTVAGKLEAARQLFAAREKQRRFAKLLNRTFELRDELKQLVEPETIVCRCEDVTFERLRKAVVYGSVLASFNVERFSLERMRTLSDDAIRERYEMFRLMSHFEVIE